MVNPIKFESKSILGHWVKRCVWSKKFECKKMFGKKKCWVKKNIVSRRISCWKWSQGKNIGFKTNVDLSLGKIRLALAEIIHCSETGTNVEGTNVGWSNAPKTDAN